MNRKKSLALMALCSLVLLLALAGCSKKEEAPSETAAPMAAPATPIDPATVATVTGSIKLEGTAPKPRKLDMSQDPACSGGMGMTEAVVSQGGNLANVFVYVKEGLGDRTFAAPTESATLDQHGCHYVPHVLGVMTGQTVKILNSDPTTHNIHPSPKPGMNREWNESQAPKGAPLEKTFAREEVLLPVKCNQHPWMKMYIGVVKSPFFSVSGKDGKFTITGLPPGKYTLAAVHETLGEQTMQVEVGAKESKTAEFSFKAAQ